MSYHTIPGVHNYCNRWCERCPLGHRCSVNSSALLFKDDQEDEPAPEDLEQEILAASEQEHMEEPEESQEPDYTLSDEIWNAPEPTAEEMEEFRRKQEELRARVDAHATVKLAQQAGECCELVVERYRKLTKNQKPPSAAGLSWHQQQKLEGEQHRIQNYIDILSWYRFPLEVKTHRALHGLLENDVQDDEPIQNDWNGTAKLCMISARHCLGAARAMLKEIPALEDELLLLLGSLQHFLESLHQTFPRAEEFIRPGFDTLGISEDLGI